MKKLEKQGLEVRKQRKGKRKRRIHTPQGEGVDIRGLTVKERMTLQMIKFRGWL